MGVWRTLAAKPITTKNFIPTHEALLCMNFIDFLVGINKKALQNA
jgi:hypothetical protein